MPSSVGKNARCVAGISIGSTVWWMYGGEMVGALCLLLGGKFGGGCLYMVNE